MEPQKLTELEQRLATPGGEALRLALMRRAEALEQRMALALAASVPRGEFAQAQACRFAARAAHETLAEWPAQP